MAMPRYAKVAPMVLILIQCKGKFRTKKKAEIFMI